MLELGEPGKELIDELNCPSEAMQRVYLQVARIAKTDLDVLIVGEKGVGKEILARRIHRESDRASRPFLKLQARRLAAAWMDSTLLGMKTCAPEWSALMAKGAATLFIAELTALDRDAQAALQHIIIDRDSRSLSVPSLAPLAPTTLRIIAATSSDPDEEIRAGRLREELLLRLGAITVKVPPLRDRQADVLPLLDYFMDRFSTLDGGEVDLRFPRSSLAPLLGYRWPGNVGELCDLARELVQSGKDPAALVAEAGAASRPGRGEDDLSALSLAEAARRASEAVEKRLILRALEENSWNRKLASERLNISYRVLLDKIRRLEIC